MTAEWDDLTRLAEAATPGPWEVDDDDCGYASPDAPMVATPWVGGRRTHIVGSPARPHGKPLPENAEFIAAANPATILRLIEHARQERLRAARWERQYAQMVAAWQERREEHHALAARLAAVEARIANAHAFLDAEDAASEAKGRQVWSIETSLVRAALAAPTDTTKEQA